MHDQSIHTPTTGAFSIRRPWLEEKRVYKLEYLPSAVADMVDAVTYISQHLCPPQAAEKLMEGTSGRSIPLFQRSLSPPAPIGQGVSQSHCWQLPDVLLGRRGYENRRNCQGRLWTDGLWEGSQLKVKKSLPVPIRSRLLDTICAILYAKRPEAGNIWKLPRGWRNPDNGTSRY